MNSGEYQLPGMQAEETEWDQLVDYDEGVEPTEYDSSKVSKEALDAARAKQNGSRLWRYGIFGKAA